MGKGDMQVATQFSIFMVNKPGVLAQTLREFAKTKINIVAMTMMDSAEHGVMRVVFAKPDLARDILTRLNLPFSETQVLCANLDNKSGALAILAEKLAKHHIDIMYAYCTAGARGGRTTGVLKVADVKKTCRTLENNHNKQSKAKRVVKRPRSSAK